MTAAVRTIVLNGWAASPLAWSRCTFPRDALFSYLEQLEGAPERLMAETATPVVLVGWSMGGSAALRLACRHPDRVAGLVLVAATPRMMEEKETLWRGMSPRRLEALSRGFELTEGQGLFGLPEGWPNPYVRDTKENLGKGIRYLLETDLRADLARMPPSSYPVHIFQSQHDGIVRPENAAYLKHVFPSARLTWVPGTEHCLPLAVPEALDRAVAACRRAQGQ